MIEIKDKKTKSNLQLTMRSLRKGAKQLHDYADKVEKAGERFHKAGRVQEAQGKDRAAAMMRAEAATQGKHALEIEELMTGGPVTAYAEQAMKIAARTTYTKSTRHPSRRGRW
jgi:hypothetical protein